MDNKRECFLRCMRILLIDNGTKYLNPLKRLLRGNSVKVIRFGKVDPSQSNVFDWILLSGGNSASVEHHTKLFSNELKLIRRSAKPIVGICLGFELIAKAFGSELTPLKQKERGKIEIQFVEKKAVPFRSVVFESHRWRVQKLGKSLKAIAKSKDGIEIIQHRRRPIIGMQFHPEKSANGKELFDQLVKQQFKRFFSATAAREACCPS